MFRVEHKARLRLLLDFSRGSALCRSMSEVGVDRKSSDPVGIDKQN